MSSNKQNVCNAWQELSSENQGSPLNIAVPLSELCGRHSPSHKHPLKHTLE